MEYFTEQAPSYREVVDKIRLKYGEHAKIMTQRSIRTGGFLGMFRREGIEVTGYIGKEGSNSGKNRLESEKKKILDVIQQENTLKRVLEEVESIKVRLDTPVQKQTEEHPSISSIRELLEDNDFSRNYIEAAMEYLQSEFSLDELKDSERIQRAVVEWIGDSLQVYRPAGGRKPRIFVLVGPTGVGKTTTIAKLAALYGINKYGDHTLNVRMITIDNYRIAAREQIEKYGDLMGIPVSCVESVQDLNKTIDLYQDADIILIDTIGKSPKDYRKLAEMREVLEGCGREAEVHLALSATTKNSDAVNILRQFEPFAYQSIVLTKLDETDRIGNILSLIMEQGKPISFLTNGQRVPQDIEEATVIRLLMNLEGFTIHRERLEKRFPPNRAVSVEWS
ncbi:MAG: flagellar biosynthesis protein FlhF [Spirochaetales bacterium]|nr:flagellar biosynthesis protein FlhF [Spirochaetales bacterium]MCF7937596.1 flagellar biosynthesis protein FlhF [Spirochaetales bacterium]